ncbi:unnamed protein product [Closterium sp. NIES-53]
MLLHPPSSSIFLSSPLCSSPSLPPSVQEVSRSPRPLLCQGICASPLQSLLRNRLSVDVATSLPCYQVTLPSSTPSRVKTFSNPRPIPNLSPLFTCSPLPPLLPTPQQLGQALSTRPDILPPEYCTELALLQDRMAPFPCHVALATVQRELGVPPSELFAEFSPAPVAAASLGQVYKARLRSGEWVAVKIQRPAVQQQIALISLLSLLSPSPCLLLVPSTISPARLRSGEWVAVKIQRPAVQQQIALDSLVVRRVAALLQPLVHGRSDLVAIADQLVCRMFDEVDYEQEGRNAERFQALYGDHRPADQGSMLTPWQHCLSCPVESKGVLCSLRQLLEEGFFHADPHPGNLVVTRGGQLAYFDFGMMGELPPQQRISIIRAVSGPVTAVAAADAPFLLSSQCPLPLVSGVIDPDLSQSTPPPSLPPSLPSPLSPTQVVHYVNRDAQGLAQDFRALHFIPPEADAAPVAAALAEVFREGEARKGDSMSGSTSGMDFQVWCLSFLLLVLVLVLFTALSSHLVPATATVAFSPPLQPWPFRRHCNRGLFAATATVAFSPPLQPWPFRRHCNLGLFAATAFPILSTCDSAVSILPPPLSLSPGALRLLAVKYRFRFRLPPRRTCRILSAPFISCYHALVLHPILFPIPSSPPQGVILRLSSVMYRFRFSLPPHLSLVVRALGSLEGTATTLDPNFKVRLAVVATAYPFNIARRLSDPSPDMRAFLFPFYPRPSSSPPSPPSNQVVATAYPFIIARLLSDPSPDMRAILRQMLLWPSGAIRWQRLQRLVSASVLSKPSPHPSSGVDSNPPREPQEGRTEAQVSAEAEERNGARGSPKEVERAALGGEERHGGQQRDELREGVDEAAVVAAAGEDGRTGVRASLKDEERAAVGGEERQGRRQRDELREGVDEAAVVAAAGDFVAYVMSAEGSSTRGWLVLDAVAAGQQWMDERVVLAGSGFGERWVEKEIGRREGKGERGGEGELRQEERGESGREGEVRQEGREGSGGEGGSGGSRVSGSAVVGARQEASHVMAEGRERGEPGVKHDSRSSARKEEVSSYSAVLCSEHKSRSCHGSHSFLPHSCSHSPMPFRPLVDPLGALAAAAPPLDPLGALAAAVQRAPELWVPLLVETAGRAEAREMAGRVVRGVAVHAADSAVENALLAVSRWLHSK